MTLDALIVLAAAGACGVLALVSLVGNRSSVTNRGFSAGMLSLAAASLCDGFSLGTDDPGRIAWWQTLALGAKCCLPATWILFSLVYSRGNYREFVRRWRPALIVAGLLPVCWLALWWSGRELITVSMPPESKLSWWVAYGGETRALIGLMLVAGVVILANLEKTFRSAVGTMQWRIKFMILGLGAIFGARIYTQSQALLFSHHPLTLLVIDSGALLIGSGLIALAYVRHGLGEIDVYPSRAVLQSSVTVLLAGGYLFVIGLLAQIASRIGAVRNFQAQILVVLLGIIVLMVLLFSDRLRQGIGRFVSRHFQRPQHDFRTVWAELTRRTFGARDPNTFCDAVARLVSETFHALSVTLWLVEESGQQLVLGASTSTLSRAAANDLPGGALAADGIADGVFAVAARRKPFELEKIAADWASALLEANPRQFPASGNRLCVPLVTGDRCLGVAVLADRVNSVPYTSEEIDLLACIGDQVAAGLLNLRLTRDLMQGKEMEAFQTMSTFFVHDLKNAASSLGLMLQNLPVHFDDPEFRADALRNIGSTVGRINHLIERLGTLRRNLEARPVPLDLNGLVSEVLGTLPDAPPGIQSKRELGALPEVLADPEQIRSVLVNLVLNSRDALETRREGWVRVTTGRHGNQAMVTVADDGCGMSAEFLRSSLFRPFHTTKKKGLGIGMFQSKMIAEANHGSLRVESEPGRGTTFKLTLPLAPSAP